MSCAGVGGESRRMTRTEVIAAVAAGTSLREADLYRVNLSGANLSGVNLTDADLSGVIGLYLSDGWGPDGDQSRSRAAAEGVTS